jgi:hypothetical protein
MNKIAAVVIDFIKTIFKFIVYFVILAIIFIIFTVYFTNDAVSNVDEFFNAIKNNNYQKASEHLSIEFKNKVDITRLKTIFPYSEFRNYKECSCIKREYNSTTDNTNNTKKERLSKIAGIIEFENNKKLPIQFTFIKENEEWKINDIKFPILKNTIFPNNATHLVKESMLKLAKAIRTNDYREFYNYIGPQIRIKASLNDIKNIFMKFKKTPINWKELKNSEPVIEQKEMSKNGVVKFVGYFPVENHKIGFIFEYYKNYEEWKLVGLSIKIIE